MCCGIPQVAGAVIDGIVGHSTPDLEGRGFEGSRSGKVKAHSIVTTDINDESSGLEVIYVFAFDIHQRPVCVLEDTVDNDLAMAQLLSNRDRFASDPLHHQVGGFRRNPPDLMIANRR